VSSVVLSIATAYTAASGIQPTVMSACVCERVRWHIASELLLRLQHQRNRAYHSLMLTTHSCKTGTLLVVAFDIALAGTIVPLLAIVRCSNNSQHQKELHAHMSVLVFCTLYLEDATELSLLLSVRHTAHCCSVHTCQTMLGIACIF
jgi:hypothetical protein